MRKSFASAVVVLALSLGGHSPSIAQEDDEGGPMMGAMGGDCPMIDMMGQGMRGHGMMGGRYGGMSAIVDGRLAYLKD
jgi:hypothetical protein